MKILYQCEICKELYDTKHEAILCEEKKFEPTVKVGDIVFARAGFGWFDGDERWIINFKKLGMYTNPGFMPGKTKNHGNCFGPCCTYLPYYVVTAITHDKRDPHEVYYHLATKFMTGKQGYQGGYTHDEGHWKPMVIRVPPPFIVKDSKSLIGMEFDWLL